MASSHTLSQAPRRISKPLIIPSQLGATGIIENATPNDCAQPGKDIQQNLLCLTDKKRNQLLKFKEQLLNGITYYKTLFSEVLTMSLNTKEQLQAFENRLAKETTTLLGVANA
jgi:hypothetical protein